jgi:hypothetical protein
MIAARLAWEERAAPIHRQLRLRGRVANAQELAILSEEPDSDPAVAIAIRAWNEVSTCRAIGMSIGPVPVSAIDSWCDRHGLDFDVAEHLKAALLYVDGDYMARMAARQKATAPQRSR